MFGYDIMLQLELENLNNSLSSASVNLSNSISSVSSNLLGQLGQPIVNPASSYSIAPGQTVVFSGSWGSSSSSQTLIAMPQGWYMIQWNSCVIGNNVSIGWMVFSWHSNSFSYGSGTGMQQEPFGVMWGDGNTFVSYGVNVSASQFAWRYLVGYNNSNLIISNSYVGGILSGSYYAYLHRYA